MNIFCPAHSYHSQYMHSQYQNWSTKCYFCSEAIWLVILGMHVTSSESQTDRVRDRTPIPLMTLSLTIWWKQICQSWTQKPKNKPITMFISRPCDWLVPLLLLPTLTNYFSVNNKRQSWKHNRKKWKRSDPSNSDSVELISPATTQIFNFH